MDAVRMAVSNPYSLIILDLMMDDMDGFQVIHHLRTNGILTPLFVLSGRQAEVDKVLALGIGADDYITKPFSTMVLCAKVKACLRRSSLLSGHANELIAGPFRYICDEMRLFKQGEEIFLSGKECLLMKYFLSNQNKILTKDQIYRYVWNDDFVDDNTIMVHIRRLRMKIEDSPGHPVYLKISGAWDISSWRRKWKGEARWWGEAGGHGQRENLPRTPRKTGMESAGPTRIPSLFCSLVSQYFTKSSDTTQTDPGRNDCIPDQPNRCTKTVLLYNPMAGLFFS